MRQMKHSGIPWIGEIPEDWLVRPVKSAFDRKNDKAQQENPIVLSLARAGVKVRDINNNEGQLAESYYNYNPVSYGDLLINPMDLYSGANCNMSEVEGVISPAYVNLRARDGYDPKYFDYYFKTQYWSMAFFAHGFGVSYENRWTLNNQTLKHYKIPVPTYEEQVKLRKYLDVKLTLIDNIIEKTKESIEEYKKYKQSLITETVTKGLNPDVKMKDSGIEWIGEIPDHWEIRNLKSLSKVISKGTTPKDISGTSSEKYCIRYIKAENIQNGVVEEEPEFYIDEVTNYELKRSILSDKDILFVIAGATIGKNAILTSNMLPANTNQAISFIRLNEMYQNEAELISYQLSSSTMTDYINIKSVQSAQPNISMENLGNFPIVISPIEIERDSILQFLSNKTREVNRLIDSKETLLQELESYKKSLIYEVVTGKKEI